MKKFEKENRQQLYVFIKKQQLTRRNARQHRLLSTDPDPDPNPKRDVSTVLLHHPITGMTRTLSD